VLVTSWALLEVELVNAEVARVDRGEELQHRHDDQVDDAGAFRDTGDC